MNFKPFTILGFCEVPLGIMKWGTVIGMELPLPHSAISHWHMEISIIFPLGIVSILSLRSGPESSSLPDVESMRSKTDLGFLCWTLPTPHDSR